MYRMHLNFRKEVYISVEDTRINYIGVLIVYRHYVERYQKEWSKIISEHFSLSVIIYRVLRSHTPNYCLFLACVIKLNL